MKSGNPGPQLVWLSPCQRYLLYSLPPVTFPLQETPCLVSLQLLRATHLLSLLFLLLPLFFLLLLPLLLLLLTLLLLILFYSPNSLFYFSSPPPLSSHSSFYSSSSWPPPLFSSSLSSTPFHPLSLPSLLFFPFLLFPLPPSSSSFPSSLPLPILCSSSSALPPSTPPRFLSPLTEHQFLGLEKGLNHCCESGILVHTPSQTWSALPHGL